MALQSQGCPSWRLARGPGLGKPERSGAEFPNVEPCVANDVPGQIATLRPQWSRAFSIRPSLPAVPARRLARGAGWGRSLVRELEFRPLGRACVDPALGGNRKPSTLKVAMAVPQRSGTVPGSRRRWLLGGMVGGLCASFGTLTAFAVSFLLPRRSRPLEQRVFLGFRFELDPGQSRLVTLPSGERMILVNTGEGPSHGFRGFSSRCPHLGCRVHFAPEGDRYVCPCHDGIFDLDGVGTSGPPAQAGQRLAAYRIEADGDSLYAAVRVA